MAETKGRLRITFVGTSINDEMIATAHEVIGLPAAVLHKVTLATGTVVYVNDFGIRKVFVEKL